MAMVSQTANDPVATTSTRERILAAARKVFLDGPPEQATMDALAQEAGMSKKTIYREFKSQFELLAALASETLDANDIPGPAPRADIELELYGLVSRLVAQMIAPRSIALARLIISEVRRYPELMKQPRPKGGPRDVIAKWLSSPAVRAQYQIEDADEAAAMLLGMIMQDAAFKLFLPEAGAGAAQQILDQRARKAVTIFLKGVKKGI